MMMMEKGLQYTKRNNHNKNEKAKANNNTATIIFSKSNSPAMGQRPSAEEHRRTR